MNLSSILITQNQLCKLKGCWDDISLFPGAGKAHGGADILLCAALTILRKKAHKPNPFDHLLVVSHSLHSVSEGPGRLIAVAYILSLREMPI